MRRNVLYYDIMKVISLLLIAMAMLLVEDAQAQYLGDEFLMFADSERTVVGQVYKQIMKNTNNQPPHEPLLLAETIVEVANEYGVDPILVAGIANVESGYFVGAINKKSKDYGIMQVSGRNIKHYGWDKKRILTDIRYSIRAGVIVLAWFAKRYEKKEPKTWMCRYNIGTRAVKGSLKIICLRYIRKIMRSF